MSHYALCPSAGEVAQEVLRCLIGLYAERIHNESHRSERNEQALAELRMERDDLAALLKQVLANDAAAIEQVLALVSPRVKQMMQTREQWAASR